MLNLTPHAIVIRDADGIDTSIPPSGTVASVSTVETVIGGTHTSIHGVSVPIVARSFGDVTGLPDDSVPCVVSALVLSAVPGRRNTFAPDTGDTAIRFADGPRKGQIIAVTRLVAA